MSCLPIHPLTLARKTWCLLKHLAAHLCLPSPSQLSSHSSPTANMLNTPLPSSPQEPLLQPPSLAASYVEPSLPNSQNPESESVYTDEIIYEASTYSRSIYAGSGYGYMVDLNDGRPLSAGSSKSYPAATPTETRTDVSRSIRERVEREEVAERERDDWGERYGCFGGRLNVW
ncbi:hypothetical protein CC78DRAFT_577551 [Lojkania enalia]|uniref:Uncharacterized protein n=1 Tax=Lojkania enalia TaxID=147567 RepID=A0A9P4KG12_9PLEO|nr:hypothetical protein CC78DRAFT_577551 [Didymosphaeria enalia]